MDEITPNPIAVVKKLLDELKAANDFTREIMKNGVPLQ